MAFYKSERLALFIDGANLYSAGKALGVEGTPSFFINGDKVEIESFNDLVAKIDAELGE